MKVWVLKECKKCGIINVINNIMYLKTQQEIDDGYRRKKNSEYG